MAADEIILGAGELYLKEFTGTDVPADAEIETDENNVGHTQGGASFEYQPTPYEVKNSYGKTVKRVVTEESCVFKSGLLTWDLTKVQLLTTASLATDNTTNTRKLTFGGNNPLKNILVRFVHKKDNGMKIRLTMIGNAGNGFTMSFTGEQETVIDAEITAIEYIKNFLAEISEEITAGA
ncbi:hypothetical protein IV487_01725 [Enterococcus saccharolyticus]|uniref:hypothetical protein n=1 Tax=Enterococcus saccharolyticus TaxID=41997 RepID=UPI001E49AE2E|nr:hypothetical protein [Enterococcus saccharolyticus]MCD5001182.1 hypothetical protein [Enterococcus saccharolyticus]